MAENTVSQVTSIVNENTPVSVEFIDENTPAVRSDRLAEHFNRSHKNVLRDIAKLRAKCPESFFGLNFEPMFIDVEIGNGAIRKDRAYLFEPMFIDVEIGNGAIRKDRAYLLTRDAFTLLVMGFTGAAAIRWKLRYIEAFSALEAAVLENRAELARQSGYLQGKDEALFLPFSSIVTNFS